MQRDAMLLGAALAAGGLGLAAGLRRTGRPPTGTALITGGSRGLGLLLAHEYLRRGARVAICARDAAELERAKIRLDGEGRPVLALPCDLRDPAEVRELVAAVRQHFGRIDTLVNNAGVIQVGPAEHMTAADYEQALAVHFWGPLHATHAVLPEMRARGSGRIVNVASIAGRFPVPHLLPYSASKAALATWSEGLRAELAKDGVSVTTVCPALMRTGSPRHGIFKGRHRQEYAWFSIGDSLPLLTAGAARAARRIARGAERGRALVVVPGYARVASALHEALPGPFLALLAMVDRALLPRPGGLGDAGLAGAESGSTWSPSWLTVLNERAARRHNEMGA